MERDVEKLVISINIDGLYPREIESISDTLYTYEE